MAALRHANLKVLAVCAHPDDETFGLGAVISTLVDQGAEVDLVCLTRGEESTLGRAVTDLSAVRRDELTAAAEVLGIREVHQFEHPDGRLSEIDIADIVADIEPLAAVSNLLLVFDDRGVSGHLDHIRATAAALAVAGTLDIPVLAWAVDLAVAAVLNAEFNTQFLGRAADEIHLRIPVERSRQQEAMRCHQSQFDGNPIPGRRIALTGDTEAMRFLRSCRSEPNLEVKV